MALKKPTKVAAPSKPAAKTAAVKTAKPAAKSAASKDGAPKDGAVEAKAAPQVTVSLKQVAARLVETQGLEKKQAEAVMTGVIELMIDHLKKGDKLRLSGLGVLQVRHSAARMGRNPATGEAIQIAAKRKIAFRPAKELKDELT